MDSFLKTSIIYGLFVLCYIATDIARYKAHQHKPTPINILALTAVFIVIAFVYVVAVYCVIRLPIEPPPKKNKDEQREPLLGGGDTDSKDKGAVHVPGVYDYIS
jgi:hypothetical protein